MQKILKRECRRDKLVDFPSYRELSAIWHLLRNSSLGLIVLIPLSSGRSRFLFLFFVYVYLFREGMGLLTNVLLLGLASPKK